MDGLYIITNINDVDSYGVWVRPLNYIFRSAKGHHPRGYCTVLPAKKGYYPLKSVSSLLFSNRLVFVDVQKRLYSGSPCHAFNKDNGAFFKGFISGFIDAEGSFGIQVSKYEKNLAGWSVKLSFHIVIHKKDQVLLENIQKCLGIGKIYALRKDYIHYNISNMSDLKVLIYYLECYPLMTQKLDDYEIFKQVYNLVLNKEHLTLEGLRKIIALKASFNLGLSEKLKLAFPDVIPVARSLVPAPLIKDAGWLAGFVSGEGCFMVIVRKANNYAVGFQISLSFVVTQHVRDELLLQKFIEYFGCGILYRKKEVFEYRVTKLSDFVEKILPFFEKYPILGIKSLDYQDFCKVVRLMQTQAHLSKKGVDEIITIKSGMNKGRRYQPPVGRAEEYIRRERILRDLRFDASTHRAVRFFSSNTAIRHKKIEKLQLDSWWIVGFADAESCFHLAIRRNNSYKSGFQVSCKFEIKLHEKDLSVIELIQESLGVGSIYRNRTAVLLRVESIKEFETIIDFFEEHGLITQKRADFELLRQAFCLIKSKEHIEEKGLKKILAIRAAMNMGA